MLLFRSAFLRAPADDSGSGGGSGESPKPLTEEDIGRIANQAITAQLKRLNIDGKITEAITALNIDAKFDGLVEKLKPKEPEGPGDKKSDGGQVPPEIAKQLQTLADQLEAEKAARAAEKTAREEAEQKHQFESARQKLYEALKEHAHGDLHDVWVDHLIHHGRLRVEEGVPLLEVEHTPVKGMPKQKDFLPFADAIPHLVGDQGSKRFMVVPDGGSGGGPKAPRGRSSVGQFDPKNPADRVRARLAKFGVDADAEFG